jgi:hypothetical protein
MTANGWFQILLFLGLLLAVTKPVGVFMTRVFSRERTFLDPLARPIERLLYRLTGVDENHEMRWTEYCGAMLLYSGVSMALLYGIERLQQWMPWNPQKFPAVDATLAFRGDRYRSGDCLHSGDLKTRKGHPWELLGRHDSHNPVGVGADMHDLCVDSSLPGGCAEPQTLRHRETR